MRYAILIRLAVPLFFLFAWWRGRREPAWRENWSQRLGRGARSEQQPLWLHAASVGEVNSAQSLLREIQQRWPDLPLLLTAFTPTGVDRLQQLAPQASCRLLPLDLPRFWARFFQDLRPRALVVLETECWPNLLRSCRQRQIPVIWLSGRLGASSVDGMPKVFGFKRLQREFERVKAFGVQTEDDASRFLALGAPAERVTVVGSLKQDLKIPSALPDAANEWRAAQHRELCWLAASTHPGEEEPVLAAHQALLDKHPQALLLLAPRHPRRADEVRALVKARGLRCVSRSQSQGVEDAQVYLVDTLGELLLFYAASDFCFVGGSLVDIGGHNLLEPAILGRSIMTGPYIETCRIDAQALEGAAALRMVTTQEQFNEAVNQFAERPEWREAAGQAAQAYAQSLGGALEKSMALLEPCITSQPATRSSSI